LPSLAQRLGGIGEEVVMRIEVDRDRCEGNAVCVGIAPDLFDLDDEDYAVMKVDEIPADQEQLAEQSVAECPRAALIRKD
jgi:ferredoxin